MNKLTIVPIAILCMTSACMAKEIVWTGAGLDNVWKTAGNWDGGKVPGENDTAVFELAEPLTVVMGQDNPLYGLSVSGSDLTLATASASISFSGPTSTVYVAENVTLTVEHKLASATKLGTVLRKTGLGTMTASAEMGRKYNSQLDKSFAEVDVREGVFKKSGNGVNVYADWLTVRDGAECWTMGYNNLSAGLSVFLEAGSLLKLNFTASAQRIDGIAGSGTVESAQDIQLYLAKDQTYVFAGEVDIGSKTITINSSATTNWCIGASDTLASAAVSGPLDKLTFAAGVGTFKLKSPAATDVSKLTAEDVEGNPITLEVNYASTEVSPVTGSGSLCIVTSATTVKGGSVTATGSLSVRDTTLTLGDGVSIANDADLSTLSSLVVESAGTMVAKPAGTLSFGKSVMIDGMFESKGATTLTGPVALKGVLTADAAVVSLTGSVTIDNGKMVGSFGDFNYESGWLESEATGGESLRLAGVAGSAFTYGRSAVLCTRASGIKAEAAQTFTIGSSDETNPIVRKGKGSVLVFAVGANATPFDGVNSGNVLVKGLVDTYSDGLCEGPFLACAKTSSSDDTYAFDLVKYASDKGFVAAADLYVDGLEGGSDSVAYLNAATKNYLIDSGEVQARAVVLQGSTAAATPLTISSGAKLKVGDGVNPALFVLNRKGSYGGARITGAGTIDFGSSEGVFTANARSGYPDIYQTKIDAKIAGSGGVTFYGVPHVSYPCIFLNGDNTYSGGTWITGVQVRPGKATAFGPDKIDVGGSKGCGGQIQFVTDGLAYANDFKIQGCGVDAGDATYDGALWFKATTTLSGAVEIDGKARMSMRDAAPEVRATLSGVVTGGKLELMGGGAATIALAGHNLYTGGTEIVNSTVAVTQDDSFGSGAVTADADSTICFENAEDIVVQNEINAAGRIKICGAGVVTFANAGDMSAAILDANGHMMPIASLPSVALCTNSAPTVATLVLATGANTLPCALSGVFDLRADADATLDLGGRTVTIRRVTGSGRLSPVNGELVETNPKRGLMMIFR